MFVRTSFCGFSVNKCRGNVDKNVNNICFTKAFIILYTNNLIDVMIK